MHVIDWAIVVAYCVMALGIGALLARRAGKSMADFLRGDDSKITFFRWGGRILPRYET